MVTLAVWRFADAHCDTILKVMEAPDAFVAGESPGTQPGAGGSGRLHVTLEGLRTAGVCAQVFACLVLERRYPGRARERGLEVVEAVRALCAAYPESLVPANRPAVLAEAAGASFPEAAGTSGQIAVVIGLEGADPLEGEVEALGLFYQRGVRLLALAWDDNPFSGTTFGFGGGLTDKGRELVEYCEELGVMVDVSHASDTAFWDVCRTAQKPFVASHSNCRAVCAAPRNLTDEMIRALADRGGVMGINLASGFLAPASLEAEQEINRAFWDGVRTGRATFDEAGEAASRAEAALPRPPADWILAHVRHAIRVGGEEIVALGGDLDGVDNLPQGIDGVQDYPRIAELLLAGGLTSSQVDKVCHRNLLRVLMG